MTYEQFKRIHSELIMSVQYIEQDLRIVYALVRWGDYNENMEDVDTASMGTLLYELKDADEKNDEFFLKEEDYQVLHEIRELRNYWCHQCYLDFHYVEDPEEHELAFQEVASRLRGDEEKVFRLQQKIEKIRIETQKTFDGRGN